MTGEDPSVSGERAAAGGDTGAAAGRTSGAKATTEPKPTLGELIRRQRELAALPMRRLADMVGISNPYLSQIERNLREPSDRVLESIAQHLKLSTEMLSASARPSDTDGQPEVIAAIRRDPDLTRAQRGAMEEMYATFREVTRENRRRGGR